MEAREVVGVDFVWWLKAEICGWKRHGFWHGKGCKRWALKGICIGGKTRFFIFLVLGTLRNVRE